MNAPSLFGNLPELAPCTGTCVGCERKPAVVGWIKQDPVAEGGAVSRVGLCAPCSRIVERFEGAQLRAHRVAQLQAARLAGVSS